jgi:hypothetical protein
MMLSGCVPRIELATPKDPITINMNVKIEHEIHIKVDKDVENLLKDQKRSVLGAHMKKPLLNESAFTGTAWLFAAGNRALTLDEAKQQGLRG